MRMRVHCVSGTNSEAWKAKFTSKTQDEPIWLKMHPIYIKVLCTIMAAKVEVNISARFEYDTDYNIGGGELIRIDKLQEYNVVETLGEAIEVDQ